MSRPVAGKSKLMSRSEMDLRLFGSSEMGEASFKLCVALFEALMDEITQAFPGEVSV